MKKLTLISFLAVLTGCMNGKHIYTADGGCLTCINNPITLEPINYDKKMAGIRKDNKGAPTKEFFDSPPLIWHELVFDGLSEKKIDISNSHAKDFLRYSAGLRYSEIARNEFSLNKSINESKTDLKSRVALHRRSETYQLTMSSQLGKYDFENNEFPVQVFDVLTVNGPSQATTLPRKINVKLSNASNIPNLKMPPSQAEKFLINRKQSRSVYLRYIVKIDTVNSLDSFSASVVRVQYIDEKPSVTTKDKKEKYLPFMASDVSS